MKVAIYSRKSKYTGKGDSIGNQIQMCKDYLSRNYPNVDIEFTEYEDEGYTGAVTNRPKFKKLIKDIAIKKYDALICYRLDRISRTVADLSSTLDYISVYCTNFISIKEQFDTSTAMGRAMINIASVFAQLERETIGERVRDNMMELAKQGKWSGGRLPLGYKSEHATHLDHEGSERKVVKLVPDTEQLKLVTQIYETYLKEGSLHKTEVYFSSNNIKSTKGVLLEKTSLKVILENPIYVRGTSEVMSYLSKDGWNVYGEPDGECGLLSYNKTKSIIKDGKYTKVSNDKEDWIAAVSSCPGVIDAATWIKVQEQFKTNRDTFPRLGKTNTALLTGKLRCSLCGSYMHVVHGKTSKKTGKKFYYYSCSMKKRTRGELCDSKNMKADKLEEAVLKSLENLGKDKKKYLKSLNNKSSEKDKSKVINDKIYKLTTQIKDKNALINNLVDKLAICPSISEVLVERIKSTKEEVQFLNEEIEGLKISLEIKSVENITLDLIDEMLDTCIDIRTAPVEQQKSIINVFIDNIQYDGHTEEVQVNIIGYSDESKKKLTLNY